MNAALDVVAGIAVAEVDVDVVNAVVVVAADVDVASVEEGTKLLVNVFVIVIVVVGGIELVPPSIVSVVVSDRPVMIVTVATFSFTASAFTTFSDIAPSEPESNTTFEATPERVFSPSKVTRAFWEEQLRFPALSLERMEVSERVIEKLVEAWVSRRGMAFPSVTLLILVSPAIVVVVHPTVSGVEQSKPVKPLVQMQEQMPFVTTLDPPF